jgi:hypothetical protein
MNVLVFDIETVLNVAGGHPHFKQFLEQWKANEELVAN